jgi:hypothetical protein
MAELIQVPTSSTCCAPEAEQSCCEPSEKSACCGTSAAGGTCGCSHGERAVDPPHHPEGAVPMADVTETDIRDQVRERYAGHAKLASDVSPRAAPWSGPTPS